MEENKSMQEPLIQFDLPAESKEPPLARMPWVWVLFGVLFVFIIAGSLIGNDKMGVVVDDTKKTSDKMLDVQMCMKSATGDAPSDRRLKLFEQQIDELLPEAKTNARAQKLRVVLRIEDHDAPFRDDLKNLAKSPSKENQAFAKLFTDPKPKKDEALALLNQIDGNELSERIAMVQVKESFGDKKIRSKTFDPAKTYGLALLLVVGFIGLGIGMILWYVYFFQRQAGKMLPKGLAMANIDWPRADRLIFVALITIGSFFVASEGSTYLTHHGTKVIDLFVYVPIFVTLGICFSVPIFGWRITPKAIGISSERLGEKVGWAFGAFFANIPILLVFILLTLALSKILPGGGHPVSEELMNHPKPAELVKVFFLACIVAPIWEEIFFRGLLFPAFAKAFGKPLYGALLSSFIFASIHPQGLLGVPVLMGVALMLCMLSYQTKSLVGNMILHGLHNGATMVAALIVLPLFG